MVWKHIFMDIYFFKEISGHFSVVTVISDAELKYSFIVKLFYHFV